jgi:3-oxoadipate enol-lactonase
MPYAVVNTTELHYRVDGAQDPARPWLVLSNSLGTDLTMWAAQLAVFTQQFRVLRYDTRGHGHSAVPAGSFGVDALAGDVIGLMDHLEIERAHFCGISMGGLTGIALGARHASRIDRLILCNTAARVGSPEIWIPRAAKVRAEGMGGLVDAVLPRWFSAEFIESQPLAFAAIRDTFLHTEREGYALNCEAINVTDLHGDLAAIQAPTLVISGTDDLAATPDQGRELAAAIKGAHYVELKSAHISNIEQAVLFNSTVIDFLTDR